MHRRQFLLTSAIVFTGSLLGLHRLAPAHAAALTRVSDGPKLALIIDDIGFSRPVAHRFLNLKIPLTFSILPRLPLSNALADTIHDHGHEIMLHQPMEPVQPDIDPGPGALYVRDADQQIATTMADNIDSLPHVIGINNHMGSRFTQEPRKLNPALTVIREKKRFFIDSLTTMRSKAYLTARRLKMSALRRDMFLDPQAGAKTTFRQLCRLKLHAIAHGSALGIGHPYPETAEGLRHFIRCNAFQGVKLVGVSSLVQRP